MVEGELAAEPEYAIEFSNVSKLFRIQHERKTTLQDVVINLFRNRGTSEEFWALKEVSFTLEKGKTLGLIGQNGAGKSTILKLVTRIIEPTSGRIRVNGRVSAMLELGTGFHPDLSGRDNIFLNGAIYGFNRKEMKERYERIVEFSELGRFIDTPVKHYSSGMYMRLGFATAITVDPDIMIIDEVLAVGDAAFSRKCHNALGDMKRAGKTLLFVSHAPGEIARFCDDVIYLSNGKAVARGTPSEVLDEYMMVTMNPSYFQASAPLSVAAPQKIEPLPSPTTAPVSPPLPDNNGQLIEAGTNFISRFWRFGASPRQEENQLALLNPSEKPCRVQLHTATETLSYNLSSLTPAVLRLEGNLNQGFTLEAETDIAVQRWPESLADSKLKTAAENWFFPMWDLRADNQDRLSILHPSKTGCGVTIAYCQFGHPPVRRSYLTQLGKPLILDPLVELGSENVKAGGESPEQHEKLACIALFLEATAPVLIEKIGSERKAPPLPESLELKVRSRVAVG
ncbi:MAG: ABC transporter ATP-binding protein [Chloroflexi bacterium]|nr:ABC transporter ATP-binding protein [Chloroflexota bacterium]